MTTTPTQSPTPLHTPHTSPATTPTPTMTQTAANIKNTANTTKTTHAAQTGHCQVTTTKRSTNMTVRWPSTTADRQCDHRDNSAGFEVSLASNPHVTARTPELLRDQILQESVLSLLAYQDLFQQPSQILGRHVPHSRSLVAGHLL